MPFFSFLFFLNIEALFEMGLHIIISQHIRLADKLGHKAQTEPKDSAEMWQDE